MSKESKFKFIVISSGWDGTAAAYHLKQEGYDVTVGQVQDKSELKNGDAKEDPEEKKERLTQYDGMVNKVPAKDLVRALLKVEDKDSYFIFCDQNSLWFYSEILLKAGFKNGLFPTHKDFLMEKERKEAMEFVKANYPGIKTIPYHEFKSSEEAIKFIETNAGVYVIQSEGDFVSTFVPQVDDAEIAKIQSISQLNKHKELYDKGSIILKTKLIDPIEVTPQIVFYNGKPVFTDLDIETKNMGDGKNNGPQCGCGSNLIISTNIGEKINKIAFPEIVYSMAKDHTGMFVWDISLYIVGDDIYFGEFCSNRLGYDASMTEMCMAGGVGNYFNSIVGGVNPLKKKFGVAIRLFNLNKKSDQVISYDGIEEYVWLYQVKMKDGEQMSVSDCWDLGVLTESGETVDEAISNLYSTFERFSFKEIYTRSEDDFRDDYPTSIVNRFSAVNHKFIEAPEYMVADDGSATSLLNHMKDYMGVMYKDMESRAHAKAESKYQGKISESNANKMVENALSEQSKKHEAEISEIKEIIKNIINED